MDLIFLVLGTIAGLIMNYSRQTIRVADSLEPVIPPAGKISIVIPAFNEEAYIGQTLQDIYNQNLVLQYPDMVEVIVVDNESTDGTADVASQYARVITVSRGLLNARHAGIEAANGEIIVFLDADMIVPPNYINLLVRHFHKPSVVAVAGSFVYKDGPLLDRLLQIQLNGWNSTAGLWNGCLWINGGTLALRKLTYYETGGFDLSIDQLHRPSLQMEAEVLLAQKLRAAGRLIVDDQAIVICSSRSLTCGQCSDQNTRECQYCREQMAGQRF